MPASIERARRADGEITIGEARRLRLQDQPLGELFCPIASCKAPLVFRSDAYDGSRCAHFALKRFQQHAAHCPLSRVARKIRAIARQAPDPLVLWYRKTIKAFRLDVVHDEMRACLEKVRVRPDDYPGVARAHRSQARRQLRRFIAPTMDLIEYRSYIPADDMQRLVPLTYRRAHVQWNDFYFKPDEYRRLYASVLRNTQVPLAVEGHVASAGQWQRKQDGKIRGLLRLKPLLLPKRDDPTVRVALHPLVWCNLPTAFDEGFAEGAIVIALGLWRTKSTPFVKPNRDPAYPDVQWFHNYYIATSLVVPEQVRVANLG